VRKSHPNLADHETPGLLLSKVASERSFRIVEVDRGAAASLYSVKWEGEEEDELTRFLEREHGIYCSKREENSCIDSRCRAHCQRQTFLQKLGQDLLDATLDYGFDTRFFSPSDNYYASHWRL
jgi:hypothetical protein